MLENYIKLLYNPTKLRVSLIFNAGYCLAVHKPPAATIIQARRKMEQEKFVGNIEHYVVYEQRLITVWENIRAGVLNQQILVNLEANITIAAGIPQLEGLKVSSSSNPNVACYVSFDAAVSEIKKWKVSWLRLAIEQELNKFAQEKIIANPAHIHGAWIKATKGISIQEYPIAKINAANTCDNTKPYSVVFNKNRNEIILIINNPQYLTTKKYIEEILNVTYAAINKLGNKLKAKVDFLKDNLIYSLSKASQDKERFGVDLPMVLLAGMLCEEHSVDTHQIQSENTTFTQNLSKKSSDLNQVSDNKNFEKYPGKGLLKVSIVKNGMEAYIQGFKIDWYNDERFDVNIEWIQKELQRLGIKYGMEQYLSVIESKIKKQENLDGTLIASGTVPVEGKSPYLYATYKDANIENEDVIIDMREFQQRRIVKRGQLIAEIRYAKPPVVGYDVYGKELVPGPGEGLDVKVDENVEVKGGGKFYAKIDGLPSIKDNSISISKVLVHEGDVNLRTGNIHFDGPVEITGAIDNGAVVEVSGDLIVHGIIRGAMVKVGGNIEARGGIVTGKTGRVSSRCDIIADYIENSNIVAGGNLIVKKVMLNTSCVCGGYIKLDSKEGVLAGGIISCKGNVITAKLGFSKGALTEVYAGVDAKSQLAVQIRTLRLERVIEKSNEDRLALRELMRKKDAQKTKKHIDKIEELKRRITKAKTLIEKMQAHLAKAKAGVKYYPESRIFVYDALSSNCKIEIAGVPIPVVNDVLEVQISSKRVRGSFIQPLEKEALNQLNSGNTTKELSEKTNAPQNKKAS